MHRISSGARTSIVLLALVGCNGQDPSAPAPEPSVESAPAAESEIARKLARYHSVRLEADLSGLGVAEREIVARFISAARAMDEAFWIQALPGQTPSELLASIEDPATRRYAEINYGPWDRLAGNEPFIEGVGDKPAGANFYPVEMTAQEFEGACAAAADGGAELRSPYTLVRRDASGALVAIPYHVAFENQVKHAASELREAARLSPDASFARYLELRAQALLTSDYYPSDVAWLEVQDPALDLVIGPIENYEDQLFNYKTAFEAFVLVRDREWSQRLARYVAFLPELQRALPVPEPYRREQPGSSSDLAAYDVVYYAGDSNAGAKTIAINLPNDERVQLEKGTRRLQLKNAMRAKFDAILVPLAGELIAADQRQHVDFNAFFSNTMFHEVAHGLGIKHTIDGSRTVGEALRDQAAVMEEGKADVLGLHMVTSLHDRGELGEGELESYYVTFLAGIFRSVRFGAASDHGRANMIRFNFFRDAGAFTRDPETGHYRADVARMREAVEGLSRRLLMLQGDGDYEAVREFVATHAVVGEELAADLARVNRAGIPVDIVFEQGESVLGL